LPEAPLDKDLVIAAEEAFGKDTGRQV